MPPRPLLVWGAERTVALFEWLLERNHDRQQLLHRHGRLTQRTSRSVPDEQEPPDQDDMPESSQCSRPNETTFVEANEEGRNDQDQNQPVLNKVSPRTAMAEFHSDYRVTKTCLRGPHRQ